MNHIESPDETSGPSIESLRQSLLYRIEHADGWDSTCDDAATELCAALLSSGISNSDIESELREFGVAQAGAEDILFDAVIRTRDDLPEGFTRPSGKTPLVLSLIGIFIIWPLATIGAIWGYRINAKLETNGIPRSKNARLATIIGAIVTLLGLLSSCDIFVEMSSDGRL